MNLPIPDDKLSAIKELIYSGNKIEAIKIHRASTGSRLVDAKNAIEKLEADFRATSPEKFVRQSARSGCLGVIVASSAVIGTLIWNCARCA